MPLSLSQPHLLQSCCYVNGEWKGQTHKARIEVFNPATGEKVGDVPSFGYDETLQVIEQANEAWRPWRALLAKDRASLLLKWAERLRHHKEDIALIMTAELGKPIT